MRNTADVTGGKPIAVLLQSISGVSAINPLVAFYDTHGEKREVLFFYFVPDTTRDRWYCGIKYRFPGHNMTYYHMTMTLWLLEIQEKPRWATSCHLWVDVLILFINQTYLPTNITEGLIAGFQNNNRKSDLCRIVISAHFWIWNCG
jgi:hypothetical protein